MDHQQIAKLLVAQYYNRKFDTSTDEAKLLTTEDVYVVSFTTIFDAWICLCATTADTSMYYELTYDPAKKEVYLNVYKIWDNLTIEESELQERLTEFP